MMTTTRTTTRRRERAKARAPSLKGAAGLSLAAALLGLSPSARASLTASEAEQIRGYVAASAHADRVRALVGRPDLTADESAAAMTGALVGTTLDAARITYLEQVARGLPAEATRQVVAAATVRGVLSLADAAYMRHPVDLDHAPADLQQLALAYGFVAGEVDGEDDAMTSAARAPVAKAIADHIAREVGFLRPESPVAPPVAKLRAQLLASLFDAMPDGPTRRVDLADRLSLTGARRSVLVDLGVLVLDASGSDAPLADARAALTAVPGARAAVDVLFIGEDRATFRSRVAVASAAAASGPLAAGGSPWSPEAAPPAVTAQAVSLTHAVAAAVVHKALDQRPGLRVTVDRDGGEDALSRVAAMLCVDAARTFDVAASRFLAGDARTATSLADAVGALAVFAPSADAHLGLSLALPHGVLAHVLLDPSGAATALDLDQHPWRFGRGPQGNVATLERDGARVAFGIEARAAAPVSSA